MTAIVAAVALSFLMILSLIPFAPAQVDGECSGELADIPAWYAVSDPRPMIDSDDDGNVHLGYLTDAGLNGQFRLLHSTFANGTWQHRELLGNGRIAELDMEIDALGQANFLCLVVGSNLSSRFVHIMDDGADWRIDNATSVSNYILGSLDMALGPQGEVHAVFTTYHQDGLRMHNYLRGYNGNWTIEDVFAFSMAPELIRAGPQVAVDQDNHAHLAFPGLYVVTDFNHTWTEYTLEVRTRAPQGWQNHSISTGGECCEGISLQLDEDGKERVLFVTGYLEPSMTLMRRVGQHWTTDVLGRGIQPQLLVDGDAERISFAGDSGQWQIGERSEGEWTWRTVGIPAMLTVLPGNQMAWTDAPSLLAYDWMANEAVVLEPGEHSISPMDITAEVRDHEVVRLQWDVPGEDQSPFIDHYVIYRIYPLGRYEVPMSFSGIVDVEPDLYPFGTSYRICALTASGEEYVLGYAHAEPADLDGGVPFDWAPFLNIWGSVLIFALGVISAIVIAVGYWIRKVE